MRLPVLEKFKIKRKQLAFDDRTFRKLFGFPKSRPLKWRREIEKYFVEMISQRWFYRDDFTQMISLKWFHTVESTEINSKKWIHRNLISRPSSLQLFWTKKLSSRVQIAQIVTNTFGPIALQHRKLLLETSLSSYTPQDDTKLPTLDNQRY